MEIKLAYLECMPHVGSEEAAGMDLRLYLGNKSTDIMTVIPPGETKRYRTGVSVAIPKGWVGLIAPRSSTGRLKCRLANTLGVIDSDYRGELAMEITNDGTEDVILENFQRIVQMVIVPHYNPHSFTVVDELSETNRGEKGWGSSGKV
ncbi:dUTPase [Pectobacterium phage My1]|uniref:dUTP diphosphatase n=1 Tax=Pectobacterium phage My1 TaxID=1204539 RepID=J9QL15_9CAUD|nr:dUTPase [Pectobacterium phage My1]AFQ22284.1 putative deoxyUTP pyrophosphatase [Pectobacterium phage My1]